MSPRAADDTLAPRAAPSQTRAHRSMARMLEAAHVVLRRDGAEAATTTAIAAEAQVSVGSLYHYFPNKEAVILALYEQKLAALRAFAAEPPPLGADWRETLTNWIVGIKLHELEIGFDFALFDAVHHYARLSDIAEEHAQAMARAMAKRLRDAGSAWSDAALHDLGLNAFYLNSSTWLYWRAVGHYERRAIDRLAAAVIAVAAPALDGSPEPQSHVVAAGS